jgi:hypothetical protein
LGEFSIVAKKSLTGSKYTLGWRVITRQTQVLPLVGHERDNYVFSLLLQFVFVFIYFSPKEYMLLAFISIKLPPFLFDML